MSCWARTSRRSTATFCWATSSTASTDSQTPMASLSPPTLSPTLPLYANPYPPRTHPALCTPQPTRLPQPPQPARPPPLISSLHVSGDGVLRFREFLILMALFQKHTDELLDAVKPPPHPAPPHPTPPHPNPPQPAPTQPNPTHPTPSHPTPTHPTPPPTHPQPQPNSNPHPVPITNSRPPHPNRAVLISCNFLEERWPNTAPRAARPPIMSVQQ